MHLDRTRCGTSAYFLATKCASTSYINTQHMSRATAIDPTAPRLSEHGFMCCPTVAATYSRITTSSGRAGLLRCFGLLERASGRWSRRWIHRACTSRCWCCVSRRPSRLPLPHMRVRMVCQRRVVCASCTTVCVLCVSHPLVVPAVLRTALRGVAARSARPLPPPSLTHL